MAADRRILMTTDLVTRHDIASWSTVHVAQWLFRKGRDVHGVEKFLYELHQTRWLCRSWYNNMTLLSCADSIEQISNFYRHGWHRSITMSDAADNDGEDLNHDSLSRLYLNADNLPWPT